MFKIKSRAFHTLSLAAIFAALTTSVNLVSQQKADASLDAAAKLIQDNWGTIVSNAWSPNFKQVYILNISPQETDGVKNQYKDRADGVLADRCIDKINSAWNSPDWFKIATKTTNRWMFATRVENGVANCYVRLPNNWADRYEAARK